jgi:hypothetical protein
MSIVLRIVCGLLATWRITHLLTAEDGPGDSVVRVRALFGQSVLGKGESHGLLLLPESLGGGAAIGVRVHRPARVGVRVARTLGWSVPAGACDGAGIAGTYD